ncbi:MAG: hypothetical protein Q9217_003408 [Psora testacea]
MDSDYLTPKYELDTCEKEKHAMHVPDLYVILHSHWAVDSRPLNDRLRVQTAAILILAAATATRPQGLVESSCARCSNRALAYEHVSIMKVRDVDDPQRTTTIAVVVLVHIKNSGGKGRRKKFILRLECIPAFCIVSHLLALALADDAFQHRFASVADIFQLQIPPSKESLQVPFKQDILQQPLFRDIQNAVSGCHISAMKALPYAKLRAEFVSLGRLEGF